MVERVKGSRRYASRFREEQAESTRAAIRSSATRLFEGDGYARTTINAIADDAGVSPESVYATFGNKRQLMRAVFEHATTGDEAPQALANGPWLDELSAEPDQRRRLALMSARTRGVLDRSAALNEMVRVAARTDPALSDLEAELDARRRSDVEGLVAMLAEVGQLRLRREAAVDVVWAIGVSDLYLRLRRGCGWSSARADELIENLIASILLPAR